jgi:hypothetical protein
MELINEGKAKITIMKLKKIDELPPHRCYLVLHWPHPAAGSTAPPIGNADLG